MKDRDSGFPVKRRPQCTESVEIKMHFDEKWNYERRLVPAEGCHSREGLPS